ncbi:MAG: hypothetical protein LBJ39_00940 [Tannerellaceae bacterium]|nr:hypothetical protein [Tannerellaceae bacterium]
METTLANTETSLTKTDGFNAVIVSAPAILNENKMSYQKALKRGEELIVLAGVVMDDTLDGQLSTYIQRVKTTIKTMKENREPFTQAMTAVTKEFTGLESGLKIPIDKCQALRDAYATKKMEERREQERLAALKLAKDQELIEAEKEYRIRYSEEVANYTLTRKAKELLWLNSLSLEDAKEMGRVAISLIGSGVVQADFCFAIKPFAYRYATREEFEEKFTLEERQKLIAEAFNEFEKDIKLFKQELLDTLPSKIRQLEEAARIAAEAAKRQAEEEAIRIAAHAAAALANAEEKARIEAEMKRRAEEAEVARIAAEAEAAKRKAEEEGRRKEETARIAAEAEAAKRKAEEEAAMKAAERKAVSFVDTQASFFDKAPKVKEGYQIVIKDVSAYILLTQFWFENEGRTLPANKFEGMTFGRIRAFCEKYAAKNEEFIESKFLEYKPVYKAK